MSQKETVSCPKCYNESGYIEAFGHVANGVCFCCKGKGTIQIDKAAQLAKLSADTRKKAEWIMNSTEDSYKNLSYSRLYKIDSFSCGGWGISEAYPNLRSHFCEVGRPAFMVAQEIKLAEYSY